LANKWAQKVRKVVPEKLVFLEAIPNEVRSLHFTRSKWTLNLSQFCPKSWTEDRRPSNMVYAPHWYDLNALFSKAFGDFSVNVQGISRVSTIPPLSQISALNVMTGDVSSESVLLGSEGRSR